MKYLYYPGCSLKSSGRSYEESMLAADEGRGVRGQGAHRVVRLRSLVGSVI